MNYVISVFDTNALPIYEDICSKLDLPLTIIYKGHGTAVKSMLDLLGIESGEKRIGVTVADSGKTTELIDMQKTRMFIGVPGHGMTVAVPIKSVGGGKTLAFLTNDKPVEKKAPDINYDYELIMVIANQGNTDDVMNAARAAGARGGTVLHGKGTGVKGGQKFYNLSIATEKEIVMILARTADKSAIMQSIITKAGPDTPAGAIAFSLPTTEIAGFGL